MATSEPAKFCQMVAGLLPKEMHIQDAPLTIREVRHGASPTTAMSHIAIQEKQNGSPVTWMEHVTDEQYRK